MAHLDCAIWCFPWISQADAGEQDHYDYTRDLLDDVIDSAKELREAGHTEPFFFLGHCAIAGALLREGQPKVLTKDPVLEPQALMPIHKGLPLFRAGFFGHYHYRQTVREYDDGPAGVYGGSVFVTEYGEDAEKGWTTYDTKTRKFEWHSISQTVKVLLEYDLGADRLLRAAPCEVGLEPGDNLMAYSYDELDIRLIVHVPEDGMKPEFKERLANVRAAIASSADNLDIRYRGAPRSATRDGAKAITSAVSLREKIKKFLEQKSGTTSADIESALKMFDKVKREVDARA
jgi:hypothetical protein